MHRFWLLFSQCVAALVVLAAALFALDRLVPGVLPFDGAAVTVREVAGSGSARPVASYADASGKSQPSVVNVFTSKQVRSQHNPLMDDPIFRRFFGDRFPSDNRPQRVSNLGSGVIVSEDGFILTNHHVIEAADEIQIALSDGVTLEAKVVGTDPETEVDRHDIAMALHRAIADLAPVERRVLYRMYLEDATIAETAHLLGLTEAEVLKIAENAAETLRGTLVEAGLIGEASGRAPVEREIARTQCLPQPVEDRRRVAAALAGAETIGTTELKPEQEMDQ